MKIEKINDNKLKIALTKQELIDKNRVKKVRIFT